MLPALEELWFELNFAHDVMVRTLEGLPSEAVNWSPGPEMNSMAVLVAHTTGAQRFLIGQLAGDYPVDRVREDEFRATADTAEELIERLREIGEHSRGVLERMTQEDLERPVITPQHGTRPAAWPIMHALQHTSEHMGQIQMTRQLWEQRGG